MSPLSDDKLREILAGCEGVTPGPWSIIHDTCAECARQGTAEYIIPELPGGWHAMFGEKADAAHIARLDPQTVAAMAAELLALREREMRLLLAEADAAVFTATPLDLLGIASLFHTDRDYALRLAAAAGARFNADRASGTGGNDGL